MDSTLFIIGIIGNIISVLVFISPIKTFWRIVRSGSTEDFEAAPYVFTLLNALLWLYYGVTKPDGLLVATVNGFGAIMEAIYVVLFLIYAADHAIRVRDPNQGHFSPTNYYTFHQNIRLSRMTRIK